MSFGILIIIIDPHSLIVRSESWVSCLVNIEVLFVMSLVTEMWLRPKNPFTLRVLE